MMTRGQIVMLHVSVALTAITGIVFAWMKYAMKSDDPFAVVNHPLQPHMLAMHVLVAPAAVFAFGWVFGNHIWPGAQNRGGRKWRSGIVAAASLAPMIVSGYLMQISTGEMTRKAMAVAHWTTSGLFVLAYVVHVAITVVRRLRMTDVRSGTWHTHTDTSAGTSSGAISG